MINNKSTLIKSQQTLSIWEEPHIVVILFIILFCLYYLSKYVPSSGIIICLILAVYSLKGPSETIQSVSILSFLILIAANVSLGRWFVFLAAFGRLVFSIVKYKLKLPYFISVLIIFSLGVFVSSLISSMFPVVSILKLISFFLGVSLVISGFYYSELSRDYWLSWLFTMGIFIVVLSIPTYFTGTGFSLNGVSFQGILSHPNDFGDILAPLIALVVGLYFFHKHRKWIIPFFIVLGLTELYTSQTRTSLFSLSLAFIFILIVSFILKNEYWMQAISNFLKIMWSKPLISLGITALIIMVTLNWSSIQAITTAFILKDDKSDSVTNILEESRGSLIQKSMQNFWEHPALGIGFGAPSNPERFVHFMKRGPFGIPVSASVEKGFMPSAVLEETGIIGAGLVLLLIYYLIKPVLLQPDLMLLWVILVCLILNFGEMIFFSVGGMGLFIWIIIGFVYVSALDIKTQYENA